METTSEWSGSLRSEVKISTLRNDTAADGFFFDNRGGGTPDSIHAFYSETPSAKYQGKMSTESLYSVPAVDPNLATAFTLLDEALEWMNEAIKAKHDGDDIDSDDAVMHVQALLPELFCCRTIGDGFGSMVNAIYHGLNNINGELLEREQLVALKNALDRIKTKPFLDVDTAIEEIMRLEDAGFTVEPGEFKHLANILGAMNE